MALTFQRVFIYPFVIGFICFYRLHHEYSFSLNFHTNSIKSLINACIYYCDFIMAFHDADLNIATSANCVIENHYENANCEIENHYEN